jgi:metal-responsive CopG/Arc/MetJ family transcriptional regulator
MASLEEEQTSKKPIANTRRFSITLPLETYLELERAAKRDFRSLSWVAGKAVQEYIERQEPLFHQRAS